MGLCLYLERFASSYPPDYYDDDIDHNHNRNNFCDDDEHSFKRNTQNQADKYTFDNLTNTCCWFEFGDRGAR